MGVMKAIIKVTLYAVVGYSLGYLVGSVVAKADEIPSDKIERVGIFTQPNGYQMIEVCSETGICNHYKVKDKDLETWEMPDEK